MRWYRILAAAAVVGAAFEAVAMLLGRRPTRARIAPGRHLLIYDGRCAFCAAAAWLLAQRVSAELELIVFDQLPRDGLLEALDKDAVLASAHYVTPAGVEYHGGESVTRVLRLVPGLEAMRVFDRPVLRGVREIGYRVVATQRSRVSRLLGVS